MRHLWVLMAAELRRLFASPVAVLFQLVFLTTIWTVFFVVSQFWGRGIADVRPLFDWLPLLLIGLVSTISMRAWAEERRTGTLELLLSLPVPTWALVLGKFGAGMGLVLLGLFCTLPIPAMVAFIGPLDWGPVIGGYVGAVCVGAAYLGLGLFVSSRTDNQVVALLVSGAVGGFLYAVGSDAVVQAVPAELGRLGRWLGTGARFESIARGVLDIRDLAYYAGLTLAALGLNVVSLDQERIGRTGGPAGARWRALAFGGVLFAVNGLLLPGWLTPVTALRYDLTANGRYSLSEQTEEEVLLLQEPVFVQALMSVSQHPRLSVLEPELRDLLTELELSSQGRVHVSYADPIADMDLAQSLKTELDLDATPFSVSEKNRKSVVTGYFHLVLRMGSETLVFGPRELSRVVDKQMILNNPEYLLVRGIRELGRRYLTDRNPLLRLPQGTRFQLVLSGQAQGHPIVEDLTDRVTDLAAVMRSESGGRILLEVVDPDTDPGLRQRLQELNLEPFVDDSGTEVWALGLLTTADRTIVMPPDQLTTSESAIGYLSSGLQEDGAPGASKVGVLTDMPDMPMAPGDAPDRPVMIFPLATFAQSMEGVQVRPVRTDEPIPAEIDVLVVTKLSRADTALDYLDQFLLNGGRVIVMASGMNTRLDRNGIPSLSLQNGGLLDWLRGHGVKVSAPLVLSRDSATYPHQVLEPGTNLRKVKVAKNPYIPVIRGPGLRARGVVDNLGAVALPFTSQLTLDAREGVESTPLLLTSGDSWLSAEENLAPDFEQYPTYGYPQGIGLAPRVVAGSLRGEFLSQRPVSLQAPLRKSLRPGTLIVIGSEELVTNFTLSSLAEMAGGEAYRNNMRLVENLVDWAAEDASLLSLRAESVGAAVLPPSQSGLQMLLQRSLFLLVLLPPLMLSAVTRAQQRGNG